MTTLKAGDRCYFDTFAGLVPCTIRKVEQDSYGNNVAIVLHVNAARGAYKRGEELRTANGRYVVPRNHVFVCCGQFRIRGEWKFEVL